MNLETVLKIESQVGGKQHYTAISIPADQLFELCVLARHHLQESALQEKLLFDTGKGCSVCGDIPVINVSGTYWLCGSCVDERLLAAPEARTLQRYDLIVFGDASFEFDPSSTGEWVRWADISTDAPAFQVPDGLSVWTLPAGTEIKINGAPFIVAANAQLAGHPANLEAVGAVPSMNNGEAKQVAIPVRVTGENPAPPVDASPPPQLPRSSEEK